MELSRDAGTRASWVISWIHHGRKGYSSARRNGGREMGGKTGLFHAGIKEGFWPATETIENVSCRACMPAFLRMISRVCPCRIAPCASMLPRRGWTIARCKFVKGVPGPRKDNFARSCYKLRRCEIDVVLVWRLDRWGRSVTDLLTTLQELAHLEVGFVSLTKALDLTTPAGRAMAGLLAVFTRLASASPRSLAACRSAAPPSAGSCADLLR